MKPLRKPADRHQRDIRSARISGAPDLPHCSTCDAWRPAFGIVGSCAFRIDREQGNMHPVRSDETCGLWKKRGEVKP